MKGALIIFIAMVVIGIILYILDITYYRKKYPVINEPPPPADDPHGESHGEGCCGLHLVCEKTAGMALSNEIIYYDDEELDRFQGREENSYTADETEEFRDILLTLLPTDVAGWALSLQKREINLPAEIKEEMLIILADLRASDK